MVYQSGAKCVNKIISQIFIAPAVVQNHHDQGRGQRQRQPVRERVIGYAAHEVTGRNDGQRQGERVGEGVVGVHDFTLLGLQMALPVQSRTIHCL